MDKCNNCHKDLTLAMTQVGGVCMRCEYDYFHNQSEQMFSIQLEGRGSKCIVSDKELAGVLAGDGEDHTNLVKPIKMSKGEISALPDFTGW